MNNQELIDRARAHTAYLQGHALPRTLNLLTQLVAALEEADHKLAAIDHHATPSNWFGKTIPVQLKRVRAILDSHHND